MRQLHWHLLLAALILLAGRPARAAGVYQIQPILRLGDKIGQIALHTVEGIWVGSLNDKGQIALVTGTPVGGSLSGLNGPLLVQYSDGGFTPIVIPGKDAPIGMWPLLGVVWSPISMNQAGNIAFSLLDQQAGTPVGTFLWNGQSQQITTIARTGMPAGDGLTLVTGGGSYPSINNHNDVALVADVKNGAGETRSGIFLRTSDGKLQPVALPDQSLPDGGQIDSAAQASLNDSGAVAFLVTRKGDTVTSAYRWANGAITPVALAGSAAPGGGNFAGIWGAWVNNKNQNVLVEANLKSVTAAHSLYLSDGSSLKPVAVVGQQLPGGTLKAVTGGVSAANDAGQHVFLASLTDSTTAAYILNADDTVSLVLKSSPTTQPGAIIRVGAASTFGVGLNNKGQVALVVHFAGTSSSTLVLLTPQ